MMTYNIKKRKIKKTALFAPIKPFESIHFPNMIISDVIYKISNKHIISVPVNKNMDITKYVGIFNLEKYFDLVSRIHISKLLLKRLKFGLIII